MDHKFYTQAKRDLEKARIALTRAQQAAEAAASEVSRLKHFVEQYEMYIQRETLTTSNIPNKGAMLQDNVVKIIEDFGAPMSIQDIVDRLNLINIEIGGENKAANLASYLSRDSRLIFERGSGWRLASEMMQRSSNTAEESIKVATRGFMTKNLPKQTAQDENEDIPF
jgi:hypothetical protein